MSQHPPLHSPPPRSQLEEEQGAEVVAEGHGEVVVVAEALEQVAIPTKISPLSPPWQRGVAAVPPAEAVAGEV